MNFQWIANQGPDLQAIERMKRHFMKPASEPPEAWFMSKSQRYYAGLLEAVTTVPDLAYIDRYLFEVGAGLKNFDRLEEWVEWFLFLLPYLVEHILERELLCHTINYFLNLYPHDISEEYSGFREDVLQTIGQAIMSEAIWRERKYNERYSGEPLYATVFFCLKYLQPDEVKAWATSIGTIQDELWRASVSKLLRGLKRFLYLVQHPGDVPVPLEAPKKRDMDTLEHRLVVAGINWPDSHGVFARPYSSLPDYLPSPNLVAFWNGIESIFRDVA